MVPQKKREVLLKMSEIIGIPLSEDAAKQISKLYEDAIDNGSIDINWLNYRKEMEQQKKDVQL